MAYEVAKLLLTHVGSFLEREQAVQKAVELGMPLHEIQEYLDWIDMMRRPPDDDDENERLDASS